MLKTNQVVRLCLILTLAAVIVILACSSKDNPVAPKTPDNPVWLYTGGIALIPGNPTDTVFKVLPRVTPHPAS